MKTLILNLFFAISCNFCFAQNKAMDSLNYELTIAQSDTAKVIIYEKMIWAAPNRKEGVEYGLKGLALAKQIHYDKGAILCGNSAGFRMVTYDSYRAIPILMQTKQLCERTHNQYELVRALGFLGHAYASVDFQKSLDYYYQCKKLMEKENISENDLPINAMIGYLYKDYGNLDSALMYLQKGYEFAIKPNTSPISSNSFYRDLGEVYYKKGQKDLALRYFRQFLATPDKKPFGQAEYGIALILRDRNQLDSAKFYAKKSLNIEQKENRTFFIIQAANLLFELYQTSNPTEALKYHLIVSASKDSLFNQEKARQLEKMAFEEREGEARMQRRIEAHQVAYDNQIKIYALLGLLAGLALVAFFLYRNKNKPYHLDYCFASTDLIDKLENIEIGAYDDWRTHSDHTPLITTFKL